MLEAPGCAPRLAGARSRSALASTFCGFRVLSNSDRAPVFSFVFFILSRPGGCKVWLIKSGSRLLAWRLSRREPVAPARPDEQKVWLWVWLEAPVSCR